MNNKELIDLVRRMRAAQKRYFRERTPAALSESKDLERRVDAAIDEANRQPGLFEATDSGGEK